MNSQRLCMNSLVVSQHVLLLLFSWERRQEDAPNPVLAKGKCLPLVFLSSLKCFRYCSVGRKNGVISFGGKEWLVSFLGRGKGRWLNRTPNGIFHLSYRKHLFSESNNEKTSNSESEKSWILESQKETLPKSLNYTRKRRRVRRKLKGKLGSYHAW